MVGRWWRRWDRRWRGTGQAVAQAVKRHRPHDPKDRGTSFYWFPLTLLESVVYLL